MDFSEVEGCQNEIGSIKEITKYFQNREASMTVVFDALAETMKRSQDTCRILKDVKKLTDKTRKLYFYLENQEILMNSTESTQHSHNSQLIDSTNVQNEGPPNKCSKEGVLAPTSEQRVPRKTEVIPRSKEHKLQKYKSQAPYSERRVTQRDLRTRRQSNFPSRKPGTPFTGVQSHSKEVLSRSRIKHNADYPKPWLDPPDRRHHEQGAQSLGTTRFRRQSVLPSAPKQPGSVNKHRRESMMSSQQGYNRPVHPKPNIQRQWRASMASSEISRTEPLRSTQMTTMLQREPRRASLLPAARPTRVYRSSRTKIFGIQKLAKIDEL